MKFTTLFAFWLVVIAFGVAIAAEKKVNYAEKYKIETDVENLGYSVRLSDKKPNCTVSFSLDRPKKDWSLNDIKKDCK